MTKNNTTNGTFIPTKTQQKAINLYHSIREHHATMTEKQNALNAHITTLERLESTLKALKTEKGKEERTQAIKAQKEVVKQAQKEYKHAQKAHENAFIAFESILDDNKGQLWQVTANTIDLTSIICALTVTKWLIKGDNRYDVQKALNIRTELYKCFNGFNVFTDDAYINRDSSTVASDLVQEIACSMLYALSEGKEDAWKYGRNKGISMIRKQISVKADLSASYGINTTTSDDGEIKFTIVNVDKAIDRLLAKEESTLILDGIKADVFKHKDEDLILIWGMLAKGYSFQKMADEIGSKKSTIQRKVEKIRKIGQSLYPNFDPTYLYIECAESLTGTKALAIEK